MSLVSVVIPAYNASATLWETLQSVGAQTYADLEIIVVDDGSIDDTFQIAQRYRETDPRLKVIRKPNGGVAQARNAGIQASLGEFVAFIDADDLWHPTKIAKQLALLMACGNETALVYSPFRRIDMQGMVLGASRNHRVEGWVINRHFYVNPIGNGSSILIRKSVLEAVGGYSPVLLENDAQGCEDLLLQLRISLRYKFATVPEYLVGYRHSPGNMSSDEERMLRSTLLSLNMVLAECPSLDGLAKRGMIGQKIWEYLKVIAQRRSIRQGLTFIRPYLEGQASAVAGAAWSDVAHKLGRLYQLTASLPARGWQAKTKLPQRHFYAYDPTDTNYADHQPMTREKEGSDKIHLALLALAPLDAAYQPEKYFGGNASASLKRLAFPTLKRRRNKAV